MDDSSIQKKIKDLEDEISRKNELMAKALTKIELLQNRNEQKDKDLNLFKEKIKNLEEKLLNLQPDLAIKCQNIKKIISCVKIQKIDWILFLSNSEKFVFFDMRKYKEWITNEEFKQNCKENLYLPDFFSIDDFPKMRIFAFQISFYKVSSKDSECENKIKEFKLLLETKENENSELKNYLQKSELLLKKVRENKEEEQEETRNIFLKYFTISQELLQNILQISDIPITDNKTINSLLSEHKLNLKNKLESIKIEGSLIFTNLQQHELVFHEKITNLCEKFIKIISHLSNSKENELTKNTEILKMLENQRTEFSSKIEENQIMYFFQIFIFLVNSILKLQNRIKLLENERIRYEHEISEKSVKILEINDKNENEKKLRKILSELFITTDFNVFLLNIIIQYERNKKKC